MILSDPPPPKKKKKKKKHTHTHTLGDDCKNITGEGTYTVLSIYGGTILTEDMVGPNNPSYTPWVLVKTAVSDETDFHANWLITKAPLFLCFFRLWGYLVFQRCYVCRRGANI